MSAEAETIRIREALDLGLQAWRTTDVRDKFLAALDDVRALEARIRRCPSCGLGCCSEGACCYGEGCPSVKQSPDAGDAVVALTELRGWALAGKGGVLNVDNVWLLDRIDRAIKPFGVLDIVQRICHDHMEGV